MFADDNWMFFAPYASLKAPRLGQIPDKNKWLSAKGKPGESETEDLEPEIARTDNAIDGLVHDLYGLTEDERRLVKESVPR